MNYTENYQLNQWESADRVLRTDFNEDNQTVDAAIKAAENYTGVVEALAAGYIAIAWKDAIAFVVLILILIVRPTGLLGERTAEKL